LTSSKYFAQCFSGLRANRRIDASVVAAALGRRYAIDAVGPRREEQPLDVAFALIKTKRQERGTFRSDSQVWAEAEAVTTVANMSDLDSAEGPRSLFVSNSRVLDGLEGFPSRITIDLASLTHCINTFLPTNGGDRAAFESMIQSLYDEGIILFDRTAFRRVFDSTVSAADDQFAMALNQHRELVEEILGPDPARAFAEVDDLSKPIAARGIDSRVLQKLRVRAEEQERRAQRAELRARITDKDKVELEKLRHEKAARHRTAIRRKRGAAAKKAKRGRRGKSGRRGKRRKR